MKDSAPELNVSSSETEEDKEEAKPDGEKDPDFNQVCVEPAFYCPTFRRSESSQSTSADISRPFHGTLVLSSLLCPHCFVFVARSCSPDFSQEAVNCIVPELIIHLLLLSKKG